jgi:hypothetical protein
MTGQLTVAGGSSMTVTGNAQIGATATSLLSIGTPPPATTTAVNQFFVGGTGVVLGQNVDTGESDFGLNFYYNSGFKYRFTHAAARIGMSDRNTGYGDIDFLTAPSGTADAAITWNNVMTIQNGGNVGIGTQTPSYPLHVVGSAYATGQAIVGGTMTVAGKAFSVGGSTFAVTGGNVGIGTPAPSRILHVLNTSSFGPYATNAYAGIDDFYLQNSNASNHSVGMIFGMTGTDGVATVASIGALGTGVQSTALVFQTRNGGTDGEKVRIDNAGNVGIGTTDPKYKLDVIGDVRATGSVYYGGTTGNTDGILYTKPDFVFEKGYKVLGTDEVEAFLKKKGHLPWLTSVKKEKKENGPVVNMTRMGFETVETAENLQLQIIELHKALKEQQDQIAALRQEVRASK